MIDEIVSLIVDLDLSPMNQSARDFYDLYWSGVIALEESRQLLEFFHYCRQHPHLARCYNVHKSGDCCLPFEVE